MRTFLRSKVTLLFLTIAVLIAVPAIAYAADSIITDGDVATTGDQTTRSLGTVNPGATVTATPPTDVSFSLDCSGNNHFNAGQTADINFSSSLSSIKDAGGVTPATGSVSATSLSNITGPTTWPNDGSNNCPTANASLGTSQVTIVAPKKAGTYTYTVAYTLNRDAGTASNEISMGNGNTNGASVTFTLTVPNAAPVINSFNGAASTTEGNTENYAINASDANNDNLTYTLTADSSNVTITNGNTANPSVKFLAPGDVILTSKVSDGVNTPATATKTVSVASACTAPSVTTQPTNQSITYGANASFTAAANGTSPNVQWEKSTDNGQSWNPVSGASSTTLSLTKPPVSDSGSKYRAVFTNSCGSATSDPATLTVDQATAKVTLSGLGPYTYDDTTHSASASTDPTGLNVDITYNGSSSAPKDAGDYNVVATVNDPNYKGSASGTLKINKADATIDVKGYTGTYDGNAHGASGTATGAGSVDLSSGLDLGQKFTDVPGGTAHWTFNGGTNYNDASGDVAITINKADATIKVNGFDGTYDGNAHGATGTATGVGGANLNSQLDLGDSFTNVPGGTANWSFNGGANYKDASGSVAITISKAKAALDVKGYTGAYDGNAHGASGTATGVKGEDLGSLLNLGASFTNVPGGTANWSFAGNGNYNPDSGTAAIVINKATPVITWSNPAAIDYGTLLSSTQLNATADVPGTFTYTPAAGTKLLAGTRTLTANFTPTDTGNYNNNAKTVSIVVNPYSFTGFFQPIDMSGVFNSAKAGSTIPVKFSLGGDKGLDILAAGSPSTQKVTCDPSATVDAIEELSTATTSGLKYDSTANQYIYTWKTQSSYAGTCQQLTVKLADGTTVKSALFKFTK